MQHIYPKIYKFWLFDWAVCWFLYAEFIAIRGGKFGVFLRCRKRIVNNKSPPFNRFLKNK